MANDDIATLMQGFPPPPAAQVRWDDGSMWRFPQQRWAFSHMEELLPTVPIRRAGPVRDLPLALRDDIAAIRYTTLDGRTLGWDEGLADLCTDGIIVVHRGRLAYRAFPALLAPEGRHIAFSVTKSFVGLAIETLVAEGRLDPQAPLGTLVPELAPSGFGDATVRQVMDMRTAIAFTEDYVPAGTGWTDVQRMSFAFGGAPRPPGYDGPDGNAAFTASIGKAGAHGGNFVYRTPNTQALQWVYERVAGESLAAFIEARIWQPLGMAQDAALVVDRLGTAFGGGGLLASLGDMARVGEMVRLGGAGSGLPAAAVEAVLRPGEAQAFAHLDYPGMPGGSYAGQWWHRADGQAMAMGVHGQMIYVDRPRELVVARFGSYPHASNRFLNPVTIPMLDALAAHLAG